MSKLKVDEIRSADRSVSSSANITLADDGNVSLGGTLSAGTIGDNVVLSDSYYLQANLNGTFTSSLPINLNFDESTSPYWVFTSDSDWHVSGTGSNFSKGTTISDLKIHRAGIYLVNFCATGIETSAERAFDISIRGVGSGSSTSLARSIDNIPIAESGTNYGAVSVSLIYKFNANDQINFFVSSSGSGSADIYSLTHFNICLIRPL